jgi:RNA polymerase sigma factor (sigma-70 family)
VKSKVVSIAFGGHGERILALRDALVVAHTALVPPIARRIHATLPPSFDLDEMIAVGNLALVKAALGYRPEDHGGTPFSAFARAAITGAIKDTFRRNKFAEQTRPALSNVLEFPSHPIARVPAIEARIDLARRFASLRNHVTACLPPREVAIINEYYSPSMPDLAEVGRRLGITRGAAEKGHATAIRTLRERMKAAA